MTVTEKLKPCPFCGSAERLAFQSVGSLVGDMPARPFRVVCTDIGHGDVHGPVAYGKAEALTAWNTRPVGEPVAWLGTTADGWSDVTLDAATRQALSDPSPVTHTVKQLGAARFLYTDKG